MPGDFSKVRNALGYLGSPNLVEELRAAIAIEAERQLLAEFSQSRSPYGEPWAAVARGGKPLVDTNALRGSRSSLPTASGVEVALAAPYASFQQFGTHWRARGIRGTSGRFLKGFKRPSARRGGIRPREMLPISRGIGPIWGPAFERVTEMVMARRTA